MYVIDFYFPGFIHSGQGKLEKSGEIKKCFPVSEFENSWVENQNSTGKLLFFEAEKNPTEIMIIRWSKSIDHNSD